MLPPLPEVARTQETSRTDSAHVPFFRLPDLHLPLDEDGTQKHSTKALLPPMYGPVRPPLPILRPIYKPPAIVSNPRSTDEPQSPGFLSSFSQVSISGPLSSSLSYKKSNRRKVTPVRFSTTPSDAPTSAVKPTLAVPVPQGFVRGWKTAQIRHPDDTLSRPSTASVSGTGNGSTTPTAPPKRRTRPRSWVHPAKPTLNKDRWGNTGDSNVDSSLDVREGRRSGIGPNDTLFLAWKSADGTAFRETVRGRGRK